MADFTPSLYGKYVSASILRIIRLLTFIFLHLFFGSIPPTVNLLTADRRRTQTQTVVCSLHF